MSESMPSAASDGRGLVNGVLSASDPSQCAAAVLLVRPCHFGFNAETAASNTLQRLSGAADAALHARTEFERVAAALTAAGVNSCIVDDTPEPIKPDAIFPNNWVSWHRDGTVVLYPMLAPSRRAERRLELLDAAAAATGFRIQRLCDLSDYEREGRFLEGTGSLVLDHVHRIVYACRSARTDESLVREWAHRLDYEPVVFDARTADGTAPYHTNIMLAIGTHWVVVCAQAIIAADRARVLGRLRASGREIIEITPADLHAFAANLLELVGHDPSGEPHSVLALSERAACALRGAHAAWTRLVTRVHRVLELSVPTIERVGGGSVRCMLAELPVARPAIGPGP